MQIPFFGNKEDKEDKHAIKMTYMPENMKFSYHVPEVPKLKEQKNKRWIDYGTGNDYPQQLLELLNSCSLHKAITMAKAKMMSGVGFIINGLPYDEFKKNITDMNELLLFDRFFSNPTNDGMTTLQDLAYQMAYDWQIFGAYSLETIWTMDHSKISSIKHIDTSRLRSGKLNDGTVDEFFYCRDWSNHKKEHIIDYSAFNTSDDGVECMYVRSKNPGKDYYGEPSYNAGIKWITINVKMGTFHLSNIDNGFAPSMSVKFFTKPESPEERDDIVSGIKNQFSGAGNAGKAMIFFSEDKETSPEIAPINVSNLDKQFLVLGEQVIQEIISAHRVTSPALLGIPIPNKLGYNNELKNSFQIFDSVVIQPERQVLEKTLNLLINKFGLDYKIEIVKIETSEQL